MHAQLLEPSEINPFVPNVSPLYPLKTSENLTVFCFQEVEKGCIGNKQVNTSKVFACLYQ